MMIAGIGGGARDGTVALAEWGRLIGMCSQERATRVRGAGVNASGVPDEALELLLERLGRSRDQIGRYVVADCGAATRLGEGFEYIDHHFAHACTAYLTSPFPDAAVVVCDHKAPEVSVWVGEGPVLRRIDWPWRGDGFAHTFSSFAAALGFRMPTADQRAEALARLRPGSRDAEVDRLVRREADGIVVDPDLDRYMKVTVGGDGDADIPARARLAASLQARLGELLIDVLREVRDSLGATRLCLGGSLFYHSSMNTQLKQSGLFSDVFVPVDPGDGGLAVGAVLHAMGSGPSLASPFLGPSYSPQETKRVLDNCKLQYSWESEEGAAQVAVRALREGRLVGWFDGAMEWGPRALGARCILANPTAPYVLENLNCFLKQRKPWRGYALSGLQESVAAHFHGPESAPFMECDYLPKDPDRFRHILPSPEVAIRMQTVTAEGSLPNFRRLLEALGQTEGLPFLVNTSFNGFHEPIVCSARDAVRVFYGTGLDLLVINQFVLRK
jgi:carbamoyltransferase